MWGEALRAEADFISITSFNEWGEGTQIEPAVYKVTPEGRAYSFYAEEKGEEEDSDGGSDFFLNLTARLVDRFHAANLPRRWWWTEQNRKSRDL